MKTKIRKAIYWTPRILCILFALFISLFALDIFAEGYNGWATLLALLIHLLPTYIVIALLWISWKHEWVGALAFAGLGAFYIIETKLRFDWVAYVFISGSLFVISLLFLWNWLLRDKNPPS